MLVLMHVKCQMFKCNMWFLWRFYMCFCINLVHAYGKNTRKNSIPRICCNLREREKKKHKNFTNQNAAYVGSFMLNHICSPHFGSIKKTHKNVVFTENCCVC